MSKNRKPTAADKASRYTGRMAASQGASVSQRQATHRYPHGAEDEGRRGAHDYERPFAQGPGTHLRLPLRPLPVRGRDIGYEAGDVLGASPVSLVIRKS